MTLRFPITTQHITRSFTPYCRIATTVLQGCREYQEDEIATFSPVNDHGINFLGVFDGHSGYEVSEYICERLPILLSKAIKRLPTWCNRGKPSLDDIQEGWDDFVTPKPKMKTMAVDHYDKNGCPATSQDEKIFDEITRIFFNLDEAVCMLHQDGGGSTACVVLSQLWDNELDQPIVITPENKNDITSLLLTSANDTYEYQKISIKLLTINVGDSKAMIVRRNGDFTACTQDDLPTNRRELRRIENNPGGFVKNGRVQGSLAMSRAFGDISYKLNFSLSSDEQLVIPKPRFQTHYMSYGDILLIASDGLFEEEAMTLNRIATITRREVNDLLSDIKPIFNPRNESFNDDDNVNAISPTTMRIPPYSYSPSLRPGWKLSESLQEEEEEERKEEEGKQKKEEGGEEKSTISPTTTPSSQTTMFDNTPAILESLWDPALVTRKLIQQSLCLGSRDNHSLIMMSFSPQIISSHSNFPTFLNSSLSYAPLPSSTTLTTTQTPQATTERTLTTIPETTLATTPATTTTTRIKTNSPKLLFTTDQINFLYHKTRSFAALLPREFVPGFPYQIFPRMDNFKGLYEADWDRTGRIHPSTGCFDQPNANLIQQGELLTNQLIDNPSFELVLEDNFMPELTKYQLLHAIHSTALDDFHHSVQPMCLLPPIKIPSLRKPAQRLFRGKLPGIYTSRGSTAQ